jgi:hypothetical protein
MSTMMKSLTLRIAMFLAAHLALVASVFALSVNTADTGVEVAAITQVE